MINATVTDLAGWVPAVILPTATLVQLVRIAVVRSVVGVSLSTWLLFGFANLGLYVYTEKYFEIQSIAGLLVTAILDFIIVAMIVVYRKKSTNQPASSR